MFDAIVIGGGVVGTSIFNKLTRLGKKVCLVEVQNDVGFGASRANSALIHSGIDCEPNTLKAKLNVRGNYLFKTIAPRLGVLYEECGHLIVGNDEEKLNKLLEKAKLNKVPSVRKLKDDELKNLEPNLDSSIKMGILAETGAIISSYELAVAFCEEAIVNGGKVHLEFDTKKITKIKGGFKLVSGDGREVEGKTIINASGASVNNINKLLKAEQYKIEHRRGEYYLLDKDEKGYVKHTVFPLPTEKSKGVLVSPTVHGNILVGPTSILGDTSTKTTKEGLDRVKEDAFKNFPTLNLRKNIRVFSGVRTLIGGDFVIERSKKVNGLIIVGGICSPGLSACPAIAEMVAEILGLNPDAELKKLKPRPKKIVMNELSITKQNEIITKNADFGKVVCKCENISLGEIKSAINGVLPAKSVDAVKRRTRAGMGRCQGGFCIFEVMEELSKKSEDGLLCTLKDGVNSTILVSKIKPNKKGKK